jgi:hypothetical protein
MTTKILFYYKKKYFLIKAKQEPQAMEKSMNSLPVVSHNLQLLPCIMTRMSSASSPRIHHWKYRL